MHQAKQPVSALTGPCGHPRTPMPVTVPTGHGWPAWGALAVVTLLLMLLTAAGTS
jgi:hypothetical protein